MVPSRLPSKSTFPCRVTGSPSILSSTAASPSPPSTPPNFVNPIAFLDPSHLLPSHLLPALGSNPHGPPLAAGDHVQVRHHPHLLLRRRSGSAPPRGRLPARLHLPRQGPRRDGAGHAPAVARARGRARRRAAPEPRRRIPPRARKPRPLRHELRHRRPRSRLPLPPLAAHLPHRLPRVHGRVARPLLPPRRADRPFWPRHRRWRRPLRARRGHARPPAAHRRDHQHPLIAAHRLCARRGARGSAQGGGQCRRGGRPLVRTSATAAVALANMSVLPKTILLVSVWSVSSALVCSSPSCHEELVAGGSFVIPMTLVPQKFWIL